MKMKNFILKLAGVTIGIAIIGGLIFSLFLNEYYLPVLPFLLLFFFLVTVLVHAYQLKLAKKDIGKFARSNMLITFFKLVAYSLIAVVYIAFDAANAITFVICLAIIYSVFSFIEVSELSRMTRKK